MQKLNEIMNKFSFNPVFLFLRKLALRNKLYKYNIYRKNGY